MKTFRLTLLCGMFAGDLLYAASEASPVVLYAATHWATSSAPPTNCRVVSRDVVWWMSEAGASLCIDTTKKLDLFPVASISAQVGGYVGSQSYTTNEHDRVNLPVSPLNKDERRRKLTIELSEPETLRYSAFAKERAGQICALMWRTNLLGECVVPDAVTNSITLSITALLSEGDAATLMKDYSNLHDLKIKRH